MKNKNFTSFLFKFFNSHRSFFNIFFAAFIILNIFFLCYVFFYLFKQNQAHKLQINKMSMLLSNIIAYDIKNLPLSPTGTPAYQLTTGSSRFLNLLAILKTEDFNLIQLNIMDDKGFFIFSSIPDNQGKFADKQMFDFATSNKNLFNLVKVGLKIGGSQLDALHYVYRFTGADSDKPFFIQMLYGSKTFMSLNADHFVDLLAVFLIMVILPNLAMLIFYFLFLESIKSKLSNVFFTDRGVLHFDTDHGFMSIIQREFSRHMKIFTHRLKDKHSKSAFLSNHQNQDIKHSKALHDYQSYDLLFLGFKIVNLTEISLNANNSELRRLSEGLYHKCVKIIKEENMILLSYSPSMIWFGFKGENRHSHVANFIKNFNLLLDDLLNIFDDQSSEINFKPAFIIEQGRIDNFNLADVDDKIRNFIGGKTFLLASSILEKIDQMGVWIKNKNLASQLSQTAKTVRLQKTALFYDLPVEELFEVDFSKTGNQLILQEDNKKTPNPLLEDSKKNLTKDDFSMHSVLDFTLKDES